MTRAPVPPQPLRGLFLDLDGTLADSLGVMRGVHRAFLADFGRVAEAAEFDRLNGPPLPDVVADLARTHALPGPLSALLARYQDHIERAYSHVAPAKGAEALLQAAARQGVPVALVTSNTRAIAEAWLKARGFQRYCTTIVAGEDVTQGKPHPAPYRMALARLSVAPDDGLAVEDTRTGASAALGAGLTTCLIGARDAPDLIAVPTLAAVTRLVEGAA